MPPGRNLIQQVEQPHKLARMLPLLLTPLLLVRRLNRWLAHDCRQFVGDSCEYGRWGQHGDMRDAQRAIGMFGV
jgi:hypothetical protein